MAAFSVSVTTMPISKKISIKLGAIDKPKKRGLGTKPIPRLGGISIVFGFMTALLILVPFVEDLRTIQFVGFVVGALIIVVLGIFDDIKDLNAKIKLLVQIIAALVLALTGTTIEMIMWPFLIYGELFSALSVPITVIWVIGVTNAVNLIDGMDGLAAGVTSISSFFLMVLCILTGSPLAVVFAAALAGSSMGFLPRNFNPAEIYMGDTGATFLGYVLAASSIMGLFKTYTLLAVLVAVLALALPIFDTAFAFFRRIRNHVPIMTADRSHIHHKLIDMGLNQKQAVMVLYTLSIITGILALIITVGDVAVFAIAVMSLFVMSVIVLLYRRRISREKLLAEQEFKEDNKEYE